MESTNMLAMAKTHSSPLTSKKRKHLAAAVEDFEDDEESLNDQSRKRKGMFLFFVVINL